MKIQYNICFEAVVFGSMKVFNPIGGHEFNTEKEAEDNIEHLFRTFPDKKYCIVKVYSKN
jgi:hypothetical protein